MTERARSNNARLEIISNLPKPIHILGIGSPFGEDTFGWDFIDELAKHNSGFVLHKLRTPMAELLSAIAGAGTVVIVDAVVGGEVDKVFFDHYSQWQPKGEALSSHGLGIVEALQVAANLSALPQRCFILGIMGNVSQREVRTALMRYIAHFSVSSS